MRCVWVDLESSVINLPHLYPVTSYDVTSTVFHSNIITAALVLFIEYREKLILYDFFSRKKCAKGNVD